MQLTKHTQRIHFPRPINHPKRPFKNPHHAASLLGIPLVSSSIVFPGGNQTPHLFNQFIQDPKVHECQNEQECRRNRGPNHTPHPLKPIETLAEGSCGGRHSNRSYHYYSVVRYIVSALCGLGLYAGTDVEWPKEKNVPTVTGRCPAAIRRRVMRSIACLKLEISVKLWS